MTILEFMNRHGASPEQIDADAALARLMDAMELGLAGKGEIPMLPSYLSAEGKVPAERRCAVLDAGGTNLRTARAVFDKDGTCRLEGLHKQPMPGTEGELTAAQLYEAMAEPVRKLGSFERVGFCFSYNVTLDRTLDGKLDFWCKEVRAPEAVGKPVGASLKAAIGAGCESVHVLNDSVAAMLGAPGAQVGVILGTGVNVCYSERCGRIPKVPSNLKSESMIISTEVGEFSGIPVSDFEATVINSSDAPLSARAEKQCSGGYLGSVITTAWQTAAEEGILPESFRDRVCDLAQVSQALAEGEQSDTAEIARIAISRAAKVAAVLCTGPILRTGEKNPKVAVEGSQYWKLTGFREEFHRYLQQLLKPSGIHCEIVRSENACLIGAARAAFAQTM